MPGSKCCVQNCSNRWGLINSFSFHMFPKNTYVRQAWINFCDKPNNWVPKEHCRVCSDHFKDSDFEKTFPGQKKRLLKYAMPTIKPRGALRLDGNHLSGRTGSKLKIIDYLQEVKLTSAKEDGVSTNIGGMLTASSDAQEVPISIISQEVLKLKSELDRFKQKYEEQEHLIDGIIEFNKTLETKLSEERAKNKNLELRIENLKGDLSKCVSKIELNKIKESLSETLSNAQLHVIMKLEKKVKWSKEDIFKAITFRYFSKQAYLFLRKSNFPLPNLKTLRFYCGKINLSSGLIYDIFKLVSIGAENMPKKERAVVLSYGQMKVSSIYEYNKDRDEVVGPYSYVQVVMARSLFGNWKQPVYIGFDSNMTEDLLMEIIIALHRASFDVVAVVGDFGLSNQETLMNLGINLNNVFFRNPLTEKKIFCFPDCSHSLKSMRYWLLHSGFCLSNGVSVTKNLLEAMIHKGDETEDSSLFNLTEQHLKYTGNTDHENISLSRQLFSRETATALRSCYDSEESESLADFIQLVSDWFDMMNSRITEEISPRNEPYEDAEEQNEKLKEMFETVASLRTIGKNNLQVFQNNILISIQSLQGLFEEMQEMFDIDFICTSKLNLDALRSLFGVLQTQVHLDEHPSPLNVINTLRIIMLGKCPGFMHSTYEDNEEILVRNILEKAEIIPLLPKFGDEDGEFDLESRSSSPEHIEEDGVESLCEQLAKKFCRSFAELGTHTEPHEEHAYSRIFHDSSIEPPSKLKKALYILESNFIKINKAKFAVKKKILHKLFNVLRKKVNIPEIIAKTFIEQRILLRMKRLNRKKLLSKNKKLKVVC